MPVLSLKDISTFYNIRWVECTVYDDIYIRHEGILPTRIETLKIVFNKDAYLRPSHSFSLRSYCVAMTCRVRNTRMRFHRDFTFLSASRERWTSHQIHSHFVHLFDYSHFVECGMYDEKKNWPPNETELCPTDLWKMLGSSL